MLVLCSAWHRLILLWLNLYRFSCFYLPTIPSPQSLGHALDHPREPFGLSALATRWYRNWKWLFFLECASIFSVTFQSFHTYWDSGYLWMLGCHKWRKGWGLWWSTTSKEAGAPMRSLCWSPGWGEFQLPARSILCGVDGIWGEKKSSQPGDCLIPGLEGQDRALCDEAAVLFCVLVSLKIQIYQQS